MCGVILKYWGGMSRSLFPQFVLMHSQNLINTTILIINDQDMVIVERIGLKCY